MKVPFVYPVLYKCRTCIVLYCFFPIYVDINKYCTGSWVYEPKLNLRVSQKLHEYSWITYNTLVHLFRIILTERWNTLSFSDPIVLKLLQFCHVNCWSAVLTLPKKLSSLKQIKYTYVVLIQINCFRNSWLLILAKEQESVDKYMQVLLFLLVKQHCIICTEELL